MNEASVPDLRRDAANGLHGVSSRERIVSRREAGRLLPLVGKT